MDELRMFRKANGLTQADVANFLGVSSPFVTRVERGQNKLPEDKLSKLLENDRGWDTSMLPSIVEITEQGMGDDIGRGSFEDSPKDRIRQVGGAGNIGRIVGETVDSFFAALRRENELLREQNEELRRDKEELREDKRRLQDTIDRLSSPHGL